MIFGKIEKTKTDDSENPFDGGEDHYFEPEAAESGMTNFNAFARIIDYKKMH